MANEDNLIPFNERTESEQREIARQGGIKSGESRRKRKAVREVMEMIASQPVTNDKFKKSVKSIAQGIDEDDIDMLTAATMGLWQSAMKGNEKAYKIIMETLDQSQAIEEMPEDDLSKSLRTLGESL